MPYITSEQRKELNIVCIANDVGELNFLLTNTCLAYLEGKDEKYQFYNDCIGALESCKLELYRRAVAPYENKKIIKNGDVYDLLS